jgi:hypothetical protein
VVLFGKKNLETELISWRGALPSGVPGARTEAPLSPDTSAATCRLEPLQDRQHGGRPAALNHCIATFARPDGRPVSSSSVGGIHRSSIDVIAIRSSPYLLLKF